MQYAQMVYEDKKIWIATNEVVVLEEVGSQECCASCAVITDVIHPRLGENVQTTIVYGLLIVNPDEDLKAVTGELSQANKVNLGFMADLSCHNFEMKDIVFKRDPLLTQLNRVRFAALVALPDSLVVGDSSTQALTAFVRTGEPVDPLNNMLNRTGLLALKSTEIDADVRLNKGNWKKFINLDKLEEAANSVMQGAT